MARLDKDSAKIKLKELVDRYQINRADLIDKKKIIMNLRLEESILIFF